MNPIILQLAGSIFPTADHFTVERVHEGVSTEIYRIRCQDAVYYLRILPEAEASFAPEVYVHKTLGARQVQVPDVLYFEHRHPLLQRSIMLTTEIAGQAIGHGANGPDVRRIIRQAGRVLAQVHTIPVEGFGWILRQDAEVDKLRAEYSTYQEWVEQHIAEPLMALEQRRIFALCDLQAIRSIMTEATELFGSEQAMLAHGDFDASHIYHDYGQFSGVIDFGEIRGANSFYDLGHFRNEDAQLLPDLLEGYADVQPLPADSMRRIWIASLLIAVRQVGRRVARDGSIDEPGLQLIRQTLRALETGSFVP